MTIPVEHLRIASGECECNSITIVAQGTVKKYYKEGTYKDNIEVSVAHSTTTRVRICLYCGSVDLWEERD
jgi:hypothetical protein